MIVTRDEHCPQCGGRGTVPAPGCRWMDANDPRYDVTICLCVDRRRDLGDLIDAALIPSDPMVRCQLCGYGADPHVQGDDGPVCEPCARIRPRLAMRCERSGQTLTAVFVGDEPLGTIARHPSGQYLASALGQVAFRGSFDDALDAIAEVWA